MNVQSPAPTAKDYASDQEVRWCPGCGDYAILKAVQKTLAELQADTSKTVFISGIGTGAMEPVTTERSTSGAPGSSAETLHPARRITAAGATQRCRTRRAKALPRTGACFAPDNRHSPRR